MYERNRPLKKLRQRLLIVLILLPAIILQGCLFDLLPYSPPVMPAPIELEVPPEVEAPPPDEPPRRGVFTLRYVQEPYTMNPIIALNRDNILLTSLLYESLFILNESLEAVPLLCSRWETEDNVTFVFEIHPNIQMHDGSTLTAEDVVYSIRQARNRGRHLNKLRGIESVNVTPEEDLSITIVLDSPNARFTRLLDIPIIKNNSIEERIPPGTGPYMFPAPNAMRLNRFTNYRHFDELPLSSINLLECYDSDLTELFDGGTLSLLWDDPTGAFDIRLNRRHEPRFYNTTSLQYLGFNANSPILRDPDVRRAIGCAIDHQYIVDNIMNVPRPGQAVASPVAISPMFDMYDPVWEHRFMDPLDEMGALLERARIADYDQDSFLELMDGYGTIHKFTLDFIVNIENSHKLAAANWIAETLERFGFDINVRALQWGNFMTALENGDFDMFYGETLLGADFDLTPLLLPGEENLNFGRTANTTYRPLIQSFLAAETQEEMSYAGGQLTLAITQNAPFIPILYKRHAIYTPMGVITRASPSQSGVFNNFHEWTIDQYELS